MRFLLDQGLPRSAAENLRAAGFDTVHTAEGGMAAADDGQILDRGRAEDRVVVTLDADFHARDALIAGAAVTVRFDRVRIRMLPLRRRRLCSLGSSGGATRAPFRGRGHEVDWRGARSNGLGWMTGTVPGRTVEGTRGHNRLDMVEKALQNRPGRFDRVIHVGAMDEDGRRALLVRHLAGDGVDDEVLERLVEQTEGFTGAQVVEVVKTLLDFSAEPLAGGLDDSSCPTLGARRIDEALADKAVAETIGERRKGRIGFAEMAT